MAIRNHWSRHDRCCWGRTGFQQLGGGAGRAGTFEVYRPLLAGLNFQPGCCGTKTGVTAPIQRLSDNGAEVDHSWRVSSVGLTFRPTRRLPGRLGA